ncbi:major facilitator superfamily domain-containing 8-like protein [Labeo rohita]|uniref:Major facilitator superfamily domain-containing 8-like protein n=1 Tax=Labeo rohita TaxID=84645 RepID=A0A498NU08_LABRO|nr:major facilitator superfamily domain-containing 8-like protein [Labeo rohita]
MILSKAVILPTIWRYLQLLEAPPYFLGLGLSAFSFSGLVSGPMFGHWSDKTRTTKTIILFSNVFEIVVQHICLIGNFMYFMGYSKWLLLSSRLVAGIGAGAGSSIFGFLTRTTLPDERARVFAAVMACRQAGLLIGPAFNIFLRLCDFKLGPFVVNKYTSPGLFMCGMWVLMQFAVMTLYWDIPPLDSFSEQHMPLREFRGEEDEPLMSLEDEHGPAAEDSYGSLSPEQTETQLSSELPPSPPDSPSLDTSDPFENFSASQEFLREEVVVLLTAQFITLFNQTALETMVTPLTQKYFGFGELGNSVMYSLCGVEVIAGFFLVRWLSRVLEDRVVLAVGLLICSGACVWCLIFLANPQGVCMCVCGRHPEKLAYTWAWTDTICLLSGFAFELIEFIIGVFLQLLGLPFVAVSQVSLFSKVTAEKTQVSFMAHIIASQKLAAKVYKTADFCGSLRMLIIYY